MTLEWRVGGEVCLAALILAASSGAQTTLYVDDDAAPAGAGTSWATAHVHLQDALAAAALASPPVEIRVAQGVYLPDRSTAFPAGSGARTDTFALVDGVALRGGYAGPGALDPDARDVMGTPSILDGDLLQDDLPGFLNDGENAYHVVSASGTGAGTVLDGFTIRHGNATSISPANAGGGMLCSSATLQLLGCRFESSRALLGGGLSASGGTLQTMTCVFEGNVAESGGAIRAQCPLQAEDCQFVDNHANSGGAAYGGAVYLTSGSAEFTDCHFGGNSVSGGAGFRRGGAIETNYSFALLRCSFEANEVTGSGGAFSFESSFNLLSASIVDCTFQNNEAFSGGALHLFNTHIPVSVQGCQFMDNHASGSGGAINWRTERLDLEDGLFLRNSADDRGGALHGDDPGFITLAISGCSFLQNSATTNAGLGGALSIDNAVVSILDSRFLRNAARRGGALRYAGGDLPFTMTNTILVGNTATVNGGALFGARLGDEGNGRKLANCTLAANDGGGGGGGIYLSDGYLDVANSVLWGNYLGNPASPDQIGHALFATVTVDSSDVQGGWAGVGNIALDPAFLAAPSPGADLVWGTADDQLGDVHLSVGSPCVDTGNNALVPFGLANDLNGHARIIDDLYTPGSGPGAIVDMGAFERLSAWPAEWEFTPIGSGQGTRR